MGGPDPFGWLGSTIEGQFAVEAIAGEGAFGVVYRGTHLGFELPIAIKCLKLPADLTEDQRRAFLATFRSEARLLHRLSRRTTGIVQALDVGVASSPRGIWTPYTVMEWLDGETLDAELRRRRESGTPPRDLRQAMALLEPAAAALAIAHEENVSHRDIKPQNLFLARTSRGGAMLKVLDFGIAKVFAETPTLAEALTQTGQGFHAFTPQYAAPEQFSPRFGATGPWTDVFAFALLIVEVVTGRAALRGNDVMQLYVASADEHDRPVPSARGVPLPAPVEAVLARALAVGPAARYHDIGELWTALEGAVSGLASTMLAPPVPMTTARPASRPPPPRTPPPTTARTHTDGENRVCTVMFVDLSALGRLADHLPAEEVRDILEQSTAAVAESVESMGGFLDRAAGDRLMAVFGVPRAGDRDAERAVHAALRSQQRLAALPLPRAAREARAAVRVGIESGRVFAGPAGSRQELTVIGEAVNVAARLLGSAPPGSVVVGRSCHRQVGKVFALDALAPPGAEPRDTSTAGMLWRVVGPANSSALPLDDFLGVETRLCGRAAERRALLDALEGSLGDARAGLVTVVGPPGAGRSRLLADFLRGLSGQSELYVAMAAQCSPLTRDQGYGLIAALLRRWFRIHEGDTVAAARERLAFGLRWFENAQASGTTGGLLGEAPDGDETGPLSARDADDGDGDGGLDDCLDRVAELVAGVVPRPAGDSVPRDDSAHAARARTAAALAQLLGALAVHAPLVLVCDDVHWADEASLELLDDLVGRLGDVPVLLACSARSELFERRPQWGEGAPWTQRIDLGPLPRRIIEEMVKDRLQRVPELDPEVVRLLADRAEGNPLTLVECLHLLVESGIVELGTDALAEPWRVHGERLGALELPSTVQGLVQARLDRLDEATRGLVGRAAVVGRSFWEGALEAQVESWRREAEAERAPPPPERSTAEELGDLRQRQLVRAREPSSIEGQRELAFAEAAIQEVAYETLSIRVRRPAHLLAAQWLERHAQGAALGPRLAFHFDRGGDLARAAAEYARAAAAAAALGQNHEALRHYQRAQEIHDASEADDEGEASDPVASTGGAGSPGSLQTPSPSPSQRVAGWRERVALRLERGDVLRRIGRPDEAATAYREARARILAAERRHDQALAPGETERWQARVEFRVALLEKLGGRTAEARALVESAIGRARAAGAEADTPPMYALLVFLHRRARDPAASWAAAIEGLRVSRRVGREGRGAGLRWREDVAELLFGLAAALYGKQRWIAAERSYAQARRVLGEGGDPRLGGIALNGMAAARLAGGDLPGARDTFRRALKLKERAGDLHQIAVGCANLADVELKLGNPAAALDQAQRSVRLGEQARAGSDLPAMQHNLAEAALASGRLELALDAASRALSLAEASARLYLAEVAATLTRIIVAAAAQPALAEAARTAEARLRRSFEEHFDAGDLRARADECRVQLDALPPERTSP